MDQSNSQAGTTLNIREVPGLPFRAGRHLSAWVRWHVSRACYADDLDLAPSSVEEKLTRAGERSA